MRALVRQTTARLLAQRLPLAAHVDGDEMQRLIVSGCRWAVPSDSDPGTGRLTGEVGIRYALRIRNACPVAAAFADPAVTVGVRKFLDVLSDRDPVADRVREAITDEQRPARGAGSAHDEVVEGADEDRDLADVLVLRLEQLLGREARTRC